MSLKEIDIVKITRPLELENYHKQYKGKQLHVWINPSLEVLADFDIFSVKLHAESAELDDLNKEMEKLIRRKKNAVKKAKGDNKATVKADFEKQHEKLTEKIVAFTNDKIEVTNNMIFEWYALILSQGKDSKHHETAESVHDFAVRSSKEDPALWPYVTNHVKQMINDHRDRAKKA